MIQADSITVPFSQFYTELKSVLYRIIISCGVRFLFAKEDFNEKKIWKEKSCVGAGSLD